MAVKKPSSEQQKIISESTDSTMLIVAGAGSGKTFTMTERVVHLIQQEHIKPQHIVGLTFTKKGAGELLDRVGRAVQELAHQLRSQQQDSQRDTPDSMSQQAHRMTLQDLELLPEVYTYDAFFQQIIRKYGLLIGISPNVTLLSQAGVNQLLTDIVMKHISAADGARWMQSIPKKSDDTIRSLATIVSDVSALHDSIANAMIGGVVNADSHVGNSAGAGSDSTIHELPIDSPSKISTGNNPYGYECLTMLEAIEKVHAWDSEFLSYFADNQFDDACDVNAIMHDAHSETDDHRGGNTDCLSERQAVRALLRHWESQALLTTPDMSVFERSEGRKKFDLSIEEIAENYDAVISNYNAMTLNICFEQLHDICAQTIEYREFLLRIVKEYVQEKRTRNLATYSDFTISTYELLKRYPSVGAEYRKQFSHIFLDEYQDTSTTQATVLALLFKGDSTAITAVGDPYQAIYDWRGASPGAFKLFQKEYGDGRDAQSAQKSDNISGNNVILDNDICRTNDAVHNYKLTQTRRNPPIVLHVANDLTAPLRDITAFDSVITQPQHRSNRLDMTHYTSSDQEVAVDKLRVPNKEVNADNIVNVQSSTADNDMRSPASKSQHDEFQQNVDQPQTLAPQDRTNVSAVATYSFQQEVQTAVRYARYWVDIARNNGSYNKPPVAILFRKKLHIQDYADALSEAGLRCKVYGVSTFLSEPEIRDILSLLAINGDHCDSASLLNLLGSPRLSLSDDAISALGEFAQNTNRERIKKSVKFALDMADALQESSSEQQKKISQYTSLAANELYLVDVLIDDVLWENFTTTYTLTHHDVTMLERMRLILLNMERVDTVNIIEQIRAASQLLAIDTDSFIAQPLSREQVHHNIQALMEQAQSYMQEITSDITPTSSGFVNWIRNSDQSDTQTDVGEQQYDVVLMTIHKSKGLEWDHVIVVDTQKYPIDGRNSSDSNVKFGLNFPKSNVENVDCAEQATFVEGNNSFAGAAKNVNLLQYEITDIASQYWLNDPTDVPSPVRVDSLLLPQYYDIGEVLQPYMVTAHSAVNAEKTSEIPNKNAAGGIANYSNIDSISEETMRQMQEAFVHFTMSLLGSNTLLNKVCGKSKSKWVTTVHTIYNASDADFVGSENVTSDESDALLHECYLHDTLRRQHRGLTPWLHNYPIAIPHEYGWRNYDAERRLMYVACTRACKTLLVLCCANDSDDLVPSDLQFEPLDYDHCVNGQTLVAENLQRVCNGSAKNYLQQALFWIDCVESIIRCAQSSEMGVSATVATLEEAIDQKISNDHSEHSVVPKIVQQWLSADEAMPNMLAAYSVGDHAHELLSVLLGEGNNDNVDDNSVTGEKKADSSYNHNATHSNQSSSSWPIQLDSTISTVLQASADVVDYGLTHPDLLKHTLKIDDNQEIGDIEISTALDSVTTSQKLHQAAQQYLAHFSHELQNSHVNNAQGNYWELSAENNADNASHQNVVSLSSIIQGGLTPEQRRRLEECDLNTIVGTTALQHADKSHTQSYYASVFRPIPSAPSRYANVGTQFHAWVEEQYNAYQEGNEQIDMPLLDIKKSQAENNDNLSADINVPKNTNLATWKIHFSQSMWWQQYRDSLYATEQSIEFCMSIDHSVVQTTAEDSSINNDSAEPIIIPMKCKIDAIFVGKFVDNGQMPAGQPVGDQLERNMIGNNADVVAHAEMSHSADTNAHTDMLSENNASAMQSRFVLQNSDQHYTIVDWKTGHYPRNNWEKEMLLFQIDVYRYALALSLGVPLSQVGGLLYYINEATEAERIILADITKTEKDIQREVWDKYRLHNEKTSE